MRTKDKSPTKQIRLREGLFNQDSPSTTRSSSSSSRNSSSSSSSSNSSSSSCDRSRSQSVSRRSRRLYRHGSRYSSASSSSSSCSRSRSRPRCCRASGYSCCRLRHRSRSYSPYSRCFYYRRQRYSTSRSSSRERYYRHSRRSRSRSSSYRRTHVYSGRFRCRFSPSPVRRSHRPRSKSPECSVRLSHEDKMDLLNIAKENAKKILGVDVIKLPSSVKFIEDQVKKPLFVLSERMVRAEPLWKTAQNKGEMDEDVELSKTSPVRKPIHFSSNNVVAKPSSSPPFSVPENKVTSRADSVGNRLPYGQWIPVKTFSSKKR